MVSMNNRGTSLAFDEPTHSHDCERYRDILQQLGWFDTDKLCFVLNVDAKQMALLAAASEKYGCEGAELLERLCVVAMTNMSGEEMHTVKESDDATNHG
jgi:hypothetical protein